MVVKKVTAFLLVLTLITASLGIGIMPVYAAGSWTGSGTKEDPYRVRTEAEFQRLADSIRGGDRCAGVYFRQTADLDLAAAGFTGIAEKEVFSGVYDGDGYTTKVGGNSLTAKNCGGMFGTLSGATVLNVGLTGTLVANWKISDGGHRGGLACDIKDGSKIVNCYSNITVQAAEGEEAVLAGLRYGGFAWWAQDTTFLNCYFGGFIPTAKTYGPFAGYTEAAATVTITNGYYASEATYIYDTKGTGDFPQGSPMEEAKLQTAAFADTMNQNREAAAEAAGMQTAELVPWFGQDGVYPSFRKATVSGLEGGGTKEDPYRISTEAEFRLLAGNISKGESYAGKYFKQTADLDLAAAGFTGIAEKEVFSGVYDGDGYTTKVGGESLTAKNCGGMFGTLSGATVLNLGLTGTLVANWKISDGGHRGGLACDIKGGSKIVNCYSNITVQAAEGEKAVLAGLRYGGFAWWAQDTAFLNCYFGGFIPTAKTYGPFAGYTEAAATVTITNGYYASEATYIYDTKGTGDFPQGSPMEEAKLQTAAFADTMNQNREAAAEAAGMQMAELVPWFGQDGVYPSFRKATVSGLEGGGTKEDPYRISTEAEFRLLAGNISKGESYAGKYFKQTADLDLAAAGFTGIAEKEVFSGVYDGGGHTTKVGGDSLSAHNTGGMFGTLSGATVLNLGLEGTLKANLSTSLGGHRAGLACDIKAGSKIINCYSNIRVEAGAGAETLMSSLRYGGFAWWAQDTAFLNCYFGGFIPTGKTYGPFAGYTEAAATVTIVNGYYPSGTRYIYDTKGTGVFPQGSRLEDVEMQTAAFADTMNQNRGAAAEAAGMQTAELVPWFGQDGVYPSFRKATISGLDGDGTKEDPYRISTEAEFWLLANNIEKGERYAGRYFKQTADLDLAAADFAGIAEKEVFSGVYDGDGHTTNVGGNSLTAKNCGGMFGTLSGATVMNLGLTGTMRVNVGTAEVTGTTHRAGLACDLKDGTKVVNCYSNITVEASEGAEKLVTQLRYGGFAWWAQDTAFVNCYFGGSIPTGKTYGPFAGYTEDAATVMITNGYYPSGAAFTYDTKGTGDFPQGTPTEESVMKTAAFADTLNGNRESAAATAGLSVQELVYWTGLDGFYPEISKEAPIESYALTVQSSDTEMGTVSGGGEEYRAGDLIALKALPKTGFKLVEWSSSNGGSFSSPAAVETAFTMPACATTVTALFAAKERPSVSPEQAAYDKYTQSGDLSFTIAAGDYTFTGIRNMTEGKDYTVSGQTVTLPEAKLKSMPATATDVVFMFEDNVTATVRLTIQDSTPSKYTLTVQPNDSSMGTASGSGRYEAGDRVALEAKPGEGYRFVEWRAASGSLSTTSSAVSTYVMPDGEAVVTAVFEAKTTALRFAAELEVSGSAVSGGISGGAVGGPVTVVPGAAFELVSRLGSGDGRPYELRMAAQSVTIDTSLFTVSEIRTAANVTYAAVSTGENRSEIRFLYYNSTPMRAVSPTAIGTVLLRVKAEASPAAVSIAQSVEGVTDSDGYVFTPEHISAEPLSIVIGAAGTGVSGRVSLTDMRASLEDVTILLTKTDLSAKTAKEIYDYKKTGDDYEAVADADGAWSLDKVEAGDYTVLIRKPGALYYMKNILTIGEEPVIFKEVGLKLGDLNQDGKVTVADTNIVLKTSNYNSTIEEAELPAADLNHDGKITIADRNVILAEANYNQSAEVE